MGQLILKYARHPIQTIWKARVEAERERARERLARDSVPQNEYFLNMARMIDNAPYDIKIVGYDPVFFENPDILDALEKAVKGRETPGEPKRVAVSAIFPQDFQNERLEELANETVFFRILRTPERINRGFIVFPEYGVGVWNLDEPTTYRPEIEEGVILRNVIVNHIAARNYLALYQQLEESRAIA